jgi:hypothetical protein
MDGAVQHGVHRTLLHHAAGVHDGDPVRESRDHGQIMRHPDERRARVAAELLHLGEDLALDRHVQRGRRFVADDERGPVQQRDGDGDALAHAAGELVRIALQPLVRRGDADLAERVPRALAGLFLGDRIVGGHGLHHLRIDAQHGIQRHHGVLEDHGDLPAPPLAHLAFGEPDELLAAQTDRPLDDPAGRIDEAHDREARDGLARTRFADEAEHLAARDIERHAVDGLHDARAGEEVGLQVLDGEDVGHARALIRLPAPSPASGRRMKRRRRRNPSPACGRRLPSEAEAG